MKYREKFGSYIRKPDSKRLFARLSVLILALSFIAISCSSPEIIESPPEERIRDARNDMDKRRYEKAYENLEELRFVTAGTRLGGEVQFLLGETGFKRGKYPEAESHYAAYLNAYPGGPFAEQAVFMQALSKVKQLQKRKIGFLSFKTYIPHDRDISLLREARVLFELYIEMYPTGEQIDIATQRAEELLIKEGRHELEIASFYLRKKNTGAALVRAKRVLDGNYPDNIQIEARDLIRKAERSLSQDENDQKR
jgi:outer membrane protein assembly factor BamD